MQWAVAATLSLLTLNCGLLRIGVFGRTLLQPAPFIGERLAALPAALREVDADLIALQEIYKIAHKREVMLALADRWPHAAYPLRRPLHKLDSGLLVLSRFAIAESRFHPFKDAPRDEKTFVHRGVFETLHDVPEFGPLRLLSFHTTAGGTRHDPESAFADAVRARQIEAILEHGERQPHVPTILIGDLNAGPPVSMDNYRQVTARGYADLFAEGAGEAAAASAVTWDSQQPLNRMGPHSHQRPQRIDHVFLKRAWLRRWRVAEARLVLTEPTVAVRGGPVTVADHYGVYVKLAPA
jgi:endonuclease/exonuclease/phosphatase family metal-dependent hydrolase